MAGSQVTQISLAMIALLPHLFCPPSHAVVVPILDRSQTKAEIRCDGESCPYGGVRLNWGRLLRKANLFEKDGKDPMQYRPRKGVYAPFGRIDIAMARNDDRNPTGKAATARGSGFLVSPCLIRTARHVVFDGIINSAADNGKGVTFSVGQGQGNAFKYEKINATPILWSKSTNGSDPGEEMVILKLERCVGEDPEIGWAELDVPTDDNQSGLQIAGFMRGRDPDQLSVHVNCSLRGAVTTEGINGGKVGQNGYFTDCGSGPNMSGAGIFYVKHGVPHVVAVHVATRGGAGVDRKGRNIILRKYSEERANLADALADRYSEIDDLIVADLLRFGRPNPLDRNRVLTRH